jgi:hypothetical protein
MLGEVAIADPKACDVVRAKTKAALAAAPAA